MTMIPDEVPRPSATFAHQKAGQVAVPTVTTSRDNMIVMVVALEMITLVLTQNVALGVGEAQIQVSLAVHLMFVALMALLGLIHIAELQTMLYLSATGVALVVHSVIKNHDYSAPSLMSYVGIYASTCCVIRTSSHAYVRILKNFQRISMFVCFAVWIDWGVQLLGRPMPDIADIIPERFRLLDYAYIQPIVWDSLWTKPNAIVFPETSFVSAFLATAFIIEISFFQRMRYIILLFTSLVATFGGSGMLLVALAIPFMLRRLRSGAITGLLVAAPVAFLVGTQLGVVDNFESRTSEFSHTDTSGYHRFVDPVNLIAGSVFRNPIDALFGSGAGNATKGLNIIWNPMAKALYEYGLIFGIIFFSLTISFMFGYGRPFIVGWTCFVNYHLLGGGFVMPWFAVMAWVLVGGYHIIQHEKEPEVWRDALPAPGV